jgi:hypothetical protein
MYFPSGFTEKLIPKTSKSQIFFNQYYFLHHWQSSQKTLSDLQSKS